MIRPIVNVPLNLMRMAQVNWDIDWRGQPSAERSDGSTQVVNNAFPRWVGSPRVVLNSGQLAQWRAIRWPAQGRLGIYRVFMVDPHVFNRRAHDVQGSAEAGLPFLTGERFDTGSGFLRAPFVEASKKASAGDTVVTVKVPDDLHMPRVGQILSHDDWPFGVVGVTPTTGQKVELDIQMPLRADIPKGDPVHLLASGLFEVPDASAGNPDYGALPVSRPQLAFREVLNR